MTCIRQGLHRSTLPHQVEWLSNGINKKRGYTSANLQNGMKSRPNVIYFTYGEVSAPSIYLSNWANYLHFNLNWVCIWISRWNNLCSFIMFTKFHFILREHQTLSDFVQFTLFSSFQFDFFLLLRRVVIIGRWV